MAKGKFSLIVAIYNSSEYLEGFLRSLKRQTYPFADLDILLIDDGSTDGSLEIARRWASMFPKTIRTFSKPNGGPGSARNIGLDHCRNEWITMCDPDDILDMEYFSQVSRFLERDANRKSQMLITRLVEFQDGDIRTTHNHPLNWKFRQGERLVDLNENPEYVHLSGGTAFVRREVVQKHLLRFDERIRPKFEDAHFIGRYLALVEQPIVGIIPGAKYLYRKQRRNGASLVQGAWAHPGSYYEVPMYGYLGLLTETRRLLGHVPPWAQCMVLYDLVWAYVADKSMHGGPADISSEQRQSMHETIDKVLTLIDAKTIRSFTTISLGWAFHNMLLGHYKAALPPTPVVVRWKVDPHTRVAKYSYMFVGPLPHETLLIDGERATPLSAKTVTHGFFGRVLIRERVITAPAAETVIYLDGIRARITSKTGLPKRGKPTPPRADLRLAPIVKRQSKARLLNRVAASRRRVKAGLIRLTTQALMVNVSRPEATRRMVVRVARRKLVASAVSRATEVDAALVRAAKQTESDKYKDAWVLMDRLDRADDNAEHLYRYLMKERPDINAWFLLDPACKDWDRLKSDGFKLVGYGSDEAVKLVLNAKYKISSHADRGIQYPIDNRRYGPDPGKIVFLQHGVTKDDLSRWLNPKSLSLMITATHAEYDSIAGSENNYKWTGDEVKLTGFPRHDRLNLLADMRPLDQRQNILIAPTWRQYLSEAIQTDDLGASTEAFEASKYGREWLAFLRSPRLEQIARRSDTKVRFLGHPNLTSILPSLDLPDYIDVLAYDQISVQEELTTAHTVISDFSSVTFDGAYAGCNVLYFHFDGNEIYRGGHVYRKGYFDYERDGLGPVAHDHSQLLDEVETLALHGFRRRTLYESRVIATFPFRDGKCSARVTAAVENLDRPWYAQTAIS